MRIRNQKDFWAGVMFLAFGLFFAGFGSRYHLGTTARMGPGYFPIALGTLLALLGGIICLGAVSSRASAGDVARFAWKPLLLVTVPAVAFGLLLPVLGMIPCIFLLVVVSSLATHEFAWWPTLLNAAVLTIICVVAFVWALNLQFQLFPAFLG